MDELYTQVVVHTCEIASETYVEPELSELERLDQTQMVRATEEPVIPDKESEIPVIDVSEQDEFARNSQDVIEGAEVKQDPTDVVELAERIQELVDEVSDKVQEPEQLITIEAVKEEIQDIVQELMTTAVEKEVEKETHFISEQETEITTQDNEILIKVKAEEKMIREDSLDKPKLDLEKELVITPAVDQNMVKCLEECHEDATSAIPSEHTNQIQEGGQNLEELPDSKGPVSEMIKVDLADALLSNKLCDTNEFQKNVLTIEHNAIKEEDDTAKELLEIPVLAEKEECQQVKEETVKPAILLETETPMKVKGLNESEFMQQNEQMGESKKVLGTPVIQEVSESTATQVLENISERSNVSSIRHIKSTPVLRGASSDTLVNDPDWKSPAKMSQLKESLLKPTTLETVP